MGTFAKTSAGKKISSFKRRKDSHHALTALDLPYTWSSSEGSSKLSRIPFVSSEFTYLLRMYKAEEQRRLFNPILRLWIQGIAKQSSSQEHISFKNKQTQTAHLLPAHRKAQSFRPRKEASQGAPGQGFLLSSLPFCTSCAGGESCCHAGSGNC